MQTSRSSLRDPANKIFYTSGSLGQGLSLATGVALNKPQSTVHVLISDGELNEGQIWEALMFISANNISNLKIAIDMNGVQLDGFTKDILPINNITSILSSFGFSVVSCDGNSFTEIQKAYDLICHCTSPSILLLNTVIGYGVKGLQGNPKSHGCKVTSEML